MPSVRSPYLGRPDHFAFWLCNLSDVADVTVDCLRSGHREFSRADLGSQLGSPLPWTALDGSARGAFDLVRGVGDAGLEPTTSTV